MFGYQASVSATYRMVSVSFHGGAGVVFRRPINCSYTAAVTPRLVVKYSIMQIDDILMVVC